MDYIVVKSVHILSSTILFGTGIGSAFYLFMANREKNIAGIHFAAVHVVIADWLFTAPAIIIQFATGMWLLHLTGYSLSDGWVRWGIALYVFAGLCWLPVVWMQIKMRDMAKVALKPERRCRKAIGGWTDGGSSPVRSRFRLLSLFSTS